MQTHDPNDPLLRERTHLADSRAALRAMREDVQALDIKDVTANWVNAAVLAAPDRRPHQGPRGPLPHPPLLRPPRLPARPRRGPGRGGRGRAVLHRPPPRPRRRRRPDGHRLARARLAAVLPRLEEGPDGHRAAPPLRLHRRRADGVRGRAPHRPRPRPRGPASCSRPRSSAPASARCATSSRRSSPSRTRSSGRGLGGSVCVQGGPGTGKTAVGLHRVAYLLYAHRDRLARTGTLVIGPNKSFLHYIEQVLPALGELEVKQATVDDLVATDVEVRGADPRRVRRRQGRRPDGRGAAPGRLVARHRPRPSPSWWYAAHAAGGCRRTNSPRSSSS